VIKHIYGPSRYGVLRILTVGFALFYQSMVRAGWGERWLSFRVRCRRCLAVVSYGCATDADAKHN
jgi:hypothetical protein